MRAASRVPSVLGLVGLLAALAFFGGNAGSVMAALNAETTHTVSATGATWSVVINNTVGAASYTTIPTNAGTNFTVDNNGDVDITGMTVTVTNGTNRRVRICAGGGTCNAGGQTVNAGATASITHTAARRPSTAGSSVTWSMRRTQTGGLTGTLTISSAVTSAQIAAGTTTNG